MAETMIVVAIIGIVVSVGPGLLQQFQRFFFLNNTRVALQRDARAAMVVMTGRLRQAESTSIIIDQAPSQPYYSRITFTDIDNNHVQFYQSGKTLYMVDGGTRTLTSSLRYIAFALPKSDDLGIVSVSFTLEQSIYQGQIKALHMASEKVRVMN